MRLHVAVLIALALVGCASQPTPKTAAARQISSRELSDLLGGYVRVMSNGQEFFCDKEKQDHFVRDVCYTRAQMEAWLLASVSGGPRVTGAPLTTPGGWNDVSSSNSSGYTSFTGSGR